MPGFNPESRLAPCLLVALLVSGCGSAGSGQDAMPPGTADKPATTSDTTLSKLYDPDYDVPDGFFVDERAATPRSYTAYHVKDVSLSYELCTDDYDVALNWEAADNASRAVNGHYVGSYENEQYFEFIRELSYPDDVGNVQSVTSPGFARVFKCSSVNRDGVDRNLRTGFGGVLNARPVSAARVRHFTEYLWQFAYFDNPQRKVLASFTTSSERTIDHTLRLAFIINQGFDRCDRVEILDWVFRADKQSGQIDRQFNFQSAFEAQVVDGIPERCE